MSAWLDQECPNWLNRISGYVYVRVFPHEISIWTGLNETDCLHLCGWAPSIYWGLEQNKWQRMGEFPPVRQMWAGTSIFFSCPQSSWYSDLQTDWDLYHQLSISHGFKLYHHLSCSPACWWQIVRLLSLHDHVNQFLIINLIIYVCIYKIYFPYMYLMYKHMNIDLCYRYVYI